MLYSSGRVVLAKTQVGAEFGFTWKCPAQVTAISDCFIAQAGWALGKTPVRAHLGLCHPGDPQGQHTQWTATDHVGAPPPCPCTADPLWRVEVGGKWSQPILAADWPG